MGHGTNRVKRDLRDSPALQIKDRDKLATEVAMLRKSLEMPAGILFIDPVSFIRTGRVQ